MTPILRAFLRRAASALMVTMLLTTGFLGLSMTDDVEATMRQGGYAPDRLIVAYKSHVTPVQKKQFLNRLHLKKKVSLNLINADLIQVNREHSLPDWQRIVKESSLVSYVEFDHKVYAGGDKKYNYTKHVNDPYMKNQWALNNTGKNGGRRDADIDAPEAWNQYKPGMPIIVAVIDSGVDYTHPDLAPNIWLNPGEDLNRNGVIDPKERNGQDDDGNGYVDDFMGWDFENWDASPMDDCDHGTHVAGIIAARGNNKYGVVGVVGQGEVQIMPLKFLDADGEGYTSKAVLALEYAERNGAFIANNSWGGSSYDKSLKEAIQAFTTFEHKPYDVAGLFIVAAGNDHKRADKGDNAYPARYNLPGMVIVGSTDRYDHLSRFSNYGKIVDLAAPGSNILSTVPHNKFDTFSGTSMATPYVTGVTAMIWNQNYRIKAARVKNILLKSVRKNNNLAEDEIATRGVANAYNAVKLAKKGT